MTPGQQTFPSSTTFPGTINAGGILFATVDLAVAGDYPGVFPGPTDFPGRGTNLVATAL